MSTTRTNTQWDVNDAPRLQATFRNDSGALVDPSTVALRVLAPSGVVTNYSYAAATLTKLSTGVYATEVPLTEAGQWFYRWESSTPGTAEEGWLRVREPRVAPIS
jgi:hypothetical protein